MRLIISRRAARQLDKISDYIYERNPSAALDLGDALRDAFTLLVRHPEAGRRTRNKVRRFSLTHFPYVIYHAVSTKDETVSIVTVVHAARMKRP